MSATEEMFDVCDEFDRVIDTAPRSIVHARGLLHRAVHIFVFNSQGQLLLQRRSANKDESPLKLTSSASGHLSAGEGYLISAVRELEEELGLAGDLEELHKFPASIDTALEHTVLYRLVTDDNPTPDPHEILALETVTLEEAARRLADDPEDFSAPLRTLLKWYLQEHHAGEASAVAST